MPEAIAWTIPVNRKQPTSRVHTRRNAFSGDTCKSEDICDRDEDDDIRYEFDQAAIRVGLKQKMEARLRTARLRRNAVLLKRKLRANELFLTAKRVSSHVMFLVDKVRIIQSCWRQVSLKKRRVSRMKDVEPNEYIVLLKLFSGPNDSFDELANALGLMEVLNSFRKLLFVTCFPPKMRSLIKVDEVRKSLAALMVSCFPQEVLGDLKTLTPEGFFLRRSAAWFVKSVLALLVIIQSQNFESYNKINSAILKLRERRGLFLESFVEWQQMDQLNLLNDLRVAYVDISLALNKTKRAMERSISQGVDPDDGAKQFADGFSKQLESLLRKVKTLTPNEDKFLAWRSGADTLLKTKMHELGSHQELSTELEVQADRDPIPSPEEKDLRFLDELQTAEWKWNAQQIFELLLDPKYCLGPSETKVSFDSLWDENVRTLAASLEQKEVSAIQTILSAMVDMRKRLCGLIPNRPDLHEGINSVLDEDLIKQKLDKSAFSMADVFDLIQFVSERIIELQSPARNEQTRSVLLDLETKGTAVDSNLTWSLALIVGLNFVLKELSVIERDLANFKLRMLAGYIVQDEGFALPEVDEANIQSEITGVTYLKEKLSGHEERLVSNTRHALAAFEFEGNTVMKVLELITMTLCSNGSPVCNVLLPLTFAEFEAQHLQSLGEEIAFLCSVVTLEIIFCQFVEARTSAREDIRKQLFSALKERDANYDRLKAIFRAAIESLNPLLLNNLETMERIDFAIDNFASGAVYKSTSQRFRSLMKEEGAALLNGSCTLRFVLSKSYDFDSEKLKRSVFAVWETEAKSILERFGKLFKLHSSIFEKVYAQV